MTKIKAAAEMIYVNVTRASFTTIVNFSETWKTMIWSKIKLLFRYYTKSRTQKDTTGLEGFVLVPLAQ